MNLLTLNAVSKQFTDRVLLDQVDFRINAGDRVGLLGLNGSGKTTLLRIIAGEESVDDGEVTLWGGVQVRILAQEPALPEHLSVLETLFYSDSPRMKLLLAYEQASLALQADSNSETLQAELSRVTEQMDRLDGWTAEANARAILSRLGVRANTVPQFAPGTGAIHFDQRVSTLSGGERKRLALARALLDPTDLLILDEPTNHLDAGTIDWLETFLLDMPAALLMVTHDRYFLQRITNRIVELERRQLVSYNGNYSSYLEQRQQREIELAAGARRRRTQMRRELEWLNQGIRARGTRSKHRKEQAYDLIDRSQQETASKVAISLASRRLGKRVLASKGIQLAYDGRTILDQIDFRLEKGERIGIIGPNGAGKTSLLEILLDRIPADQGNVDWGETVAVGYYDQQAKALQGLEVQNKRIIDFVDEIAALIRTDSGHLVDAAQMLTWFLFDRGQQQARILSLSGGERRRLNLRRALAHQPNVLILDEPTNDLDLETLQVLEEFLDHFQGSLIVVSHDRYFMDRNVDFLIRLEDGHLSGRYPTPYETYVRLRAEEIAADGPLSKSQVAEPVRRAERPTAKLGYKENREFEALTARIAEIEAEQVALEAAVELAAADYQKLEELAAQLESLEQEYNAALERWMDLEVRAG